MSMTSTRRVMSDAVQQAPVSSRSRSAASSSQPLVPQWQPQSASRMQSRTGKSCGGKRAIRCSCTQADLWMGIFGRTDCASPVPPSHPLLSHSLPDTDMDGDNELLRSRSKATWSGLFFSCQPFVLFPPTDSFALSFSLTRSLGSRTCGSADLLTTCCSLTICRPTVRE